MHSIPVRIVKKVNTLNIRCCTQNLQINTSLRCRPFSHHRLQAPWNIMFFGTDNFAVNFLTALNEDRKRNGGLVGSLSVTVPCLKCAVRSYAEDNGLNILEWPISPAHGAYDVGVIVSFGHLIPANIINVFPNGILNVHPSLLPKWRGASPIIHSLLAGDEHTGVTVMDIAASKFDVGPLLLQKKFAIPPECSALQLQDLSANIGKDMLLYCLKNLTTIERKTQSGKSSYASKFKSNCGNIHWEKQTMVDIDRQYRALSEVFPIKSTWNGQKIKLQNQVRLSTMQDPIIQQVLSDSEKAYVTPPGFPFYLRKQKILCIKCRDGWMGYKNIVLKKTMSAEEFYNGYLSKPKLHGLPLTSEDSGLHRYWMNHKKNVDVRSKCMT